MMEQVRSRSGGEQIFWMDVVRQPECFPSCPSDGHRVLVTARDDFHADLYGFARVRALHCLLGLRHALDDMAGRSDLRDVLYRLVYFTDGWDGRGTDEHTYTQLHRLMQAVVRYIARRLTAIKDGREVRSYKHGRIDGAMYGLTR